MTGFAPMLFWIAVAVTTFHVAYAVSNASFLIALYVFALLQLAKADRWRMAFYSGLAVGLLIAVVHLQFFWRIFSGGSVVLWLVYAFWIGLFVALARLCLVRFGSKWGWLVIPFVWTGLEYFRGELYYLRFSWLNVGYAFIGAPWQGTLRFTGVYGLGFILAGLAAGAACLWSSVDLVPGAPTATGPQADPRRRKSGAGTASSPVPAARPPKHGDEAVPALDSNRPYTVPCCAGWALLPAQKRRIGATALFSLGIGGICLGGFLCNRGPSSQPRAKVRVAGVQMEFPTEREVLFRLKDLVRLHPETELVMLSEYTFDEPVPETVRNWCRQNRRYLVVGGKDPAPRGSFFDTAFVIGPDGKTAFRQVKAVPIQLLKDGQPATEQSLWNSPWGKIGICVCYDLSYSRVTDRLVGLGAEALVVPTMDVADWGTAQHALHARIAPARATEYGLPIFRVASSGISQLVDRAGRVTAMAPCPGDGSILAGTLEMRGAGKRPLDRWLAPFATAGTAVAIVGLSFRRRAGIAPPVGSKRPEV